MCGIAGIINWSDLNKPYTDYLEDMCADMNHRGPDDWGMAASKKIKNIDKTYEIKDEGKGIFLGHKRLSILDLSITDRISSMGRRNASKARWNVCLCDLRSAEGSNLCCA
jgi:asparagine synthetase B (glutamine-hydrolysing)